MRESKALDFDFGAGFAFSFGFGFNSSLNSSFDSGFNFGFGFGFDFGFGLLFEAGPWEPPLEPPEGTLDARSLRTNAISLSGKPFSPRTPSSPQVEKIYHICVTLALSTRAVAREHARPA
ncbi:hypothetical protein PMIN03_001353 [Paraphaeosphaeria minitans]